MADVRDVLDTVEDVQRDDGRPGRLVQRGRPFGDLCRIRQARGRHRAARSGDPANPRLLLAARRHSRHAPGSVAKTHHRWPTYWRTLLSRDVRAAGADGDEVQRPLLDRPKVRAFLEQVYAQAAAQAVQMLAVFTSGPQYRHNSARQLLEAFPNVRFGRRLRLEYLSDSDHTFSSEANRTRLMELIVDWARATQFGPGAD